MAEDFGFKVQKGRRTQGPLTAHSADKKLKKIATDKSTSQPQKNKAAINVGKRAGPNVNKMKGYTSP